MIVPAAGSWETVTRRFVEEGSETCLTPLRPLGAGEVYRWPLHEQQNTVRKDLGRACRRPESRDAGGLYVDLHLVHEVTSPQAFTGLRERGLERAPAGPHAWRRWTTRRRRRREADGSRGRPAGGEPRSRSSSGTARSSASRCTRSAATKQGIVHVIGPELGLTQPGMTIVCGDSHTSHPRRVRRAGVRHRHERGGARAGDAVPAAAQAENDGRSRRRHAAPGRDRERHHPGAHRAGSASAAAPVMCIEYTGSAIRALSMEERMTICNMSIEAARAPA